jgi:hypothetical protein
MHEATAESIGMSLSLCDAIAVISIECLVHWLNGLVAAAKVEEDRLDNLAGDVKFTDFLEAVHDGCTAALAAAKRGNKLVLQRLRQFGMY